MVGKREALELVLLGLLADGHVLIEDYPGLAKTLVGALVRAGDRRSSFDRIQFTPDLMPSDVTGSSICEPAHGDFEFRPGPIFANLLLADEINRAPPKTQAALLEAMQERQVTIEGVTHQLARPFLVLATQNPIEYEGTYPLPEAQLDRFLLRVVVRLPERERRVGGARAPARAARRTRSSSTPVVDAQTLLAMQRAIEDVHVAESVGLYIVDLVAATRDSTATAVGASPRGSLALLKLARCRAALARPRLRHARRREGGRRARARAPADAEARALGAALRPRTIVRELLETVPTPAAEDRAPRAGVRRRVTASASPRVRRTPASPRVFLLAALGLAPAGAGRARARRSRCSLVARRSRLARAPELRVAGGRRACDRARGRASSTWS